MILPQAQSKTNLHVCAVWYTTILLALHCFFILTSLKLTKDWSQFKEGKVHFINAVLINSEPNVHRSWRLFTTLMITCKKSKTHPLKTKPKQKKKEQIPDNMKKYKLRVPSANSTLNQLSKLLPILTSTLTSEEQCVRLSYSSYWLCDFWFSQWPIQPLSFLWCFSSF